VESAGKSSGVGRAVCTRAQDSLDGGFDQLLDMSPVVGRSAGIGLLWFVVGKKQAKRKIRVLRRLRRMV
jgi:hypothetical protein